MSNLIPLEDAAKMLGLTVDKLNEMRSSSEIFGYKDGTSWKFKMQEIERVADELGVTVGSADAVEDDEFDISLEDDDLDFDLGDSSVDLIQEDSVESQDNDEDDGDDLEFILDDEEDDTPAAAEAKEQQEELEFVLEDDGDDDLEFVMDEEPSQPESKDEEEVEISLVEDDDDDLVLEGDDDFDLADDGPVDVNLSDDKKEEELSFGSSDIRLAGGDDAELEIEASGDSMDDLLGVSDEAEEALAMDSGDLLKDIDEGDMLMSEDDLFEDDLQIQESHEDDLELSSDFDDSEDLILEDSDSSADADIGDSDILAADSGDLDLSGSLLDLSAADDVDEMIVLDDPTAAADAEGDDNFNLTPLEEVVEEEASGSQIIALEDSEMFTDESEATLLSPEDEFEAAPMLTEDALDVGDFGAFDGGMTPGMAMGAGATTTVPEQPYTASQIASLGLVLFLLLVGGMVGYDLARNLWLPEDQIVSGGVLKLILGLVGG